MIRTLDDGAHPKLALIGKPLLPSFIPRSASDAMENSNPTASQGLEMAKSGRTRRFSNTTALTPRMVVRIHLHIQRNKIQTKSGLGLSSPPAGFPLPKRMPSSA